MINTSIFPFALASSSGNIADFNFGAAGDWGCFTSSKDTVNNIMDKNPELVLALGDFSYMSTADCWLDLIEPFISKVKIAIGNHELRSQSLLNQYMSTFNLTKQYYSFNYQNIHFTVLSTEIPFKPDSDQYKFLVNDLSKALQDQKIDWIIAAFHRHKEGLPSFARTYFPLFDKFGVDLVLYSHHHAYDRSYPVRYTTNSSANPIITDNNTSNYINPKGQIHAKVGTGGAYIHAPAKERPFIVSQYYGHGFLNVDVIKNGTTLNATFYANDGTVGDQFTVLKSFQKCERISDFLLANRILEAACPK
jgi:hypothetical protein